MTLDEIKKAIQFRKVEDEGYTSIEARLVAKAVFSIGDSTDYRIDLIKESLIETIIRNIYDNQVGKMCEALNEFLKECHPIPGRTQEFFEARAKLIASAKYQQPK